MVKKKIIAMNLEEAVTNYVATPTEQNFDVFYAALRKFAVSTHGSDSEDAVQETALAVWQQVNSGQVDAIETPAEWVRSILRNAIRDHVKLEHRRKVRETAVAWPEDRSYQPDLTFEESEARDAIYNRLTPQEQALCDWLRMNDDQVSYVERGKQQSAERTRNKVIRLVENEFSLGA